MVGCATSKPIFHSTVKKEVYLDPYHTWSNSPMKCFGQSDSPMRSITLRLINKRFRNVDVDVLCRFADGTLFGKRSVSVEKRNDKVFMVRGFAPLYEDAKVFCGITGVK